jgi:hypothetical protein
MNYETVEFLGKKPSLAQIVAKVKPLAKSGSSAIEVLWGENWLKVERHCRHSYWYGMGHIKTLSADSVAKALNQGVK